LEDVDGNGEFTVTAVAALLDRFDDQSSGTTPAVRLRRVGCSRRR
jgi:hypothetical protein